MSTTPTPEAPSPELLRMHNAGQLLANCAFNIAQHAGEPVSESVAATLKQCQSEWDAACLAFKAARAALTQGAGAVEPVEAEPFGWYTSEFGDVDDIEWSSQRPTYEGDWRPLYCGVRLQQAVKRVRENALAPIQQAIRDYHYALDTRQHGGMAQINAFDAICGHLDMDWQPGQEAAIRAKGTHD